MVSTVTASPSNRAPLEDDGINDCTTADPNLQQPHSDIMSSQTKISEKTFQNFDEYFRRRVKAILVQDLKHYSNTIQLLTLF